MPDRQETPDSAPDAEPSLSQGNTPSFSQQLQQFLKARSELLGLEAKEASLVAARKVVLVVMAIGAAIVTYLLILILVAWAIHHLLLQKLSDGLSVWSFPITILILAALHLGAALIFSRKAKSKNYPPLFEFTRSEWQKDRTWFNKKTSRDENEN